MKGSTSCTLMDSLYIYQGHTVIPDYLPDYDDMEAQDTFLSQLGWYGQGVVFNEELPDNMS